MVPKTHVPISARFFFSGESLALELPPQCKILRDMFKRGEGIWQVGRPNEVTETFQSSENFDGRVDE